MRGRSENMAKLWLQDKLRREAYQKIVEYIKSKNIRPNSAIEANSKKWLKVGEK
jgi:hypothetical protein